MTSFLARIYAFKFFDSFILIFPLYAVMFADAGLSPLEIAIVLTCWSASAFVVEVPAGVVADLWPRKWVLAWAQLARAACFVIWWIDPHFWGFLVGLVLWGVKSGFTNGTFEALLYDELKSLGRAADYPRLFGRARALQALAVIGASLGAAVVAPFGYGVALAASLVAIALAVAAAASLPPAARAARTHEADGYLARLRLGLSHARRSRTILSILAFSAVVLALGGALEEFWPIFGVKVGLTRSMVAIFVAGQQAMEAVGSLNAHRLARRPRRWLHGLFALAGLVLAGAAAIWAPPAMLLLALYSGLTRLIDVALEGQLQHEIASETRATIGSVKGFAAQIGVSSMYMLVGPFAQATSYRASFLACGALAATIGAVWLAASQRRSKTAMVAGGASGGGGDGGL